MLCCGILVLYCLFVFNWLICGYCIILIVGVYGKLILIGMLVIVLCEFGVDLSFVNGGVIVGYGCSLVYGVDEFFVVEVDEFDGFFLLYDIVIVLIINVDVDYFDYYGM